MPSWSDLKDLLERRVPRGSVTTYAEVSAYFYDGNRSMNQPVRSMLAACARRDGDLTHRVIRDDGSVDRPGGAADQRRKLEAEGVKFTDDGSVDLGRFPAVVLTR